MKWRNCSIECIALVARQPNGKADTILFSLLFVLLVFVEKNYVSASSSSSFVSFYSFSSFRWLEHVKIFLVSVTSFRLARTDRRKKVAAAAAVVRATTSAAMVAAATAAEASISIWLVLVACRSPSSSLSPIVAFFFNSVHFCRSRQRFSFTFGFSHSAHRCAHN